MLFPSCALIFFSPRFSTVISSSAVRRRRRCLWTTKNQPIYTSNAVDSENRIAPQRRFPDQNNNQPGDGRVENGPIRGIDGRGGLSGYGVGRLAAVGGCCGCL